MSSVRICPSILNADRQNLFSEILRIASVSDLLHLDVMDNKFVPNFTFSFEEAVHIIEQSPLAVDSHLMIADPDIQAPLYAEHGSASVTFHLEAASDVKSLISNIAWWAECDPFKLNNLISKAITNAMRIDGIGL